ncbi:hypothetical protein GPDM_01205, partial [Planococcus donghaensis MPA1U2]
NVKSEKVNVRGSHSCKESKKFMLKLQNPTHKSDPLRSSKMPAFRKRKAKGQIPHHKKIFLLIRETK